MKNLTGQKFGRLLVLKFLESRDNKRFWLCLCDCGKFKEKPTGELTNGGTLSCGCMKREKILKATTTHGLTKTPEYQTWAGIKKRCLNSKNKDYHHYGGRGITICKRWLNSFENFLEDMGERPSKNHSIDRIDNNSNYCKENCRWATQKEQKRNTRKNKKVINTITNEIFNSLIEAAISLNMNRVTLQNQLTGKTKNKTNLKFY